MATQFKSDNGYDKLGKKYKPINCLGCGEWICDAHIFRGRLRLRCPNCGRIMVLVFRQRKRSKGSSQLNNK
jgi:predicted RNA-binding Zn-ribbon protein involved in translation (DUF1610 family)